MYVVFGRMDIDTWIDWYEPRIYLLFYFIFNGIRVYGWLYCSIEIFLMNDVNLGMNNVFRSLFFLKKK